MISFIEDKLVIKAKDEASTLATLIVENNSIYAKDGTILEDKIDLTIMIGPKDKKRLKYILKEGFDNVEEAKTNGKKVIEENIVIIKEMLDFLALAEALGGRRMNNKDHLILLKLYENKLNGEFQLCGTTVNNLKDNLFIK